MSDPFLRPTSEGDLPALSDLTDEVFGRRRSPELLRWLVLGGGSGVALESRVVEVEGRVVGHVAALSGRYLWAKRTAVGVHPILWLVAPGARGKAGRSLGLWCTAQGDFNLVVGGTPTSRSILDARGFARAGTAVELRLPAAPAPAGEWELVHWQEDHADEGESPAIVVHRPTPERLRWLAACPELEAALRTLRRSGRCLGPALFYVDRRASPPRGRIVHLPWVAEDPTGALRRALAELAALGCATASYQASSPSQLAAAISLGGEPFYERPIFFRDRAALPDPPGWHLSYLEGDLAYRRV